MASAQTSNLTGRPGVSVVIPAYNYARFLPKAIDSVLKQEYSHYEIIVVDDGSTDNTAEVVAAYGDKVRYLHKQNGGLPAARNTGIKAARFDYIGFLDADDEWLPGFLQRAMETFARMPEQFAMVACRPIIIDLDGNVVGKKRLLPKMDLEITCRDLLFRSNFSPSSVVTKRKVFEECGLFDEKLRSSEDREMWLRILSRYSAMLNNDRLIVSRRHPNNMSKNADRMRENTRKVLRMAYDNGYVPRSAVGFWLKVFSFNHFETAWMYRNQGRHGEALGELLLSIVKWPFFLRPNLLNEHPFFRIRGLIRFTGEWLAKPFVQAAPAQSNASS